MKQKLLHFFAVFVALVMAIPIANAVASDYKINAPTKDWTVTFSLPDGNSRQPAISADGQLFILSETEKALGFISTYRMWSTGPQLVNLGWTSAGSANAFDDAGNYVTHTAGSAGPTQTATLSPATKYCVRPFENPEKTENNGIFGSGKGIDMSTYNTGGVTLYCDATGDVLNANNGVLWFAQTGTKSKIIALSVGVSGSNLATTGKKEFETGIASGGGNDNYVQFYESSNASAMKCLLLVRGVGIYDVTLNYTAGTVTSVNEIPSTANNEYNSIGAHIFMLRGRKLLCRNTRALDSTNGQLRNCYTEFEILDITDSYTNPTKIATINHLNGATTTGASIGGGHNTGSYVQTHKVSDDQVAIFAYAPGAGCSRYLITASAITNPVTSLSAAVVSGTANNVKVTWAKPSAGNPTKYSVCYSTNGGSSWSTAVETTNLNYTYTNLADGTYTFKVTSYYGGSSTWGEAATSGSVTVTNYTDPVTNMQVQTGSGMPYSAIVNWNAPSGEDTPSKYAVSYSTDGGTSWSTAVETTSLSYTYSGLTQGEYIFKVTPYYGSAAGEATTQAATVYGVTTPVSTVNVAYYNNTGNSVAVTWTVPATDVAPDKYQVCYSSDGGSSWSTAVETTELTYVYSNLPLGTYTFKVTPIYNGVAGDAALSENINSLAPSGYTFTTSKRWEVRGTWGTDAAPDGRSIAVSNNMMYVASPNTDTQIAYISQGTSSTSWPKFETGFAKQNYGLGMDNDDEGNIIMSSGIYFGSANGFSQFTVYPAGATSNASKVDIAIEGDYIPGSRCDFIAATGNVYSGTGYIWFAQNGKSSIKRIKIENKSGVPTPTEVTTWTLPISTTNQVVLRPLEDGRLYFHNRTGSCAIITLPEGGGEVTSSMIEDLSISTTAKGNMNSDMFMLHNNIFHVRNDGAASSSIGVEIKNLTTAGNGDATYMPFDGLTPADGNSTVSGVSTYGSLVRAVKVDDNTADIYCYSPNHGVTVYRVTSSPVYTVTGAIKSLDYEYTTVETEEGTRQDVVLSWEAPEEATPTSYKIYYNTGDDKELVATVAAPALTYTDKNVNANHTYTVIPYFAGVAEDEALGLSVTTTEVQTVLFAPIITEMRSYDGYSIAQFFFKMPSLSKVKPASYNVYRDGILLESGITQLNFIDDDLPKIEKEVEESHDYVYTVEAVYSSTYDNATRMSEGKTATVTYRDWSLAGYLLQDVYNVPINQALGNMPVNFTNYEYYRQGHFYNGSWYIAERADALSKKDQDKANGDDKSTRSEIESDDANATGGVVVFGATNEVDVRAGMVGKVITNDAFESIGLAIDDYGTIFVRNNNLDKLAATAPNDGNPTQIKAYPDGFTRRITEGALYQLKDGAYPSEPSAIVDLSALWTDNRFIDDMVFSSGKSNGQVAGRSDYYNMYGDVMSAEGGYLIFSPSWTRTIFKVKIVNGVYDSHEVLEFSSSYTEENSYTGKIENHNILTGTENYGFKIAGRDAWMAQIRSNGYFGIHGVEEGHEGEEHEHEWHAIFNTDSRINNSGGTSIVAFDNPLTTEVNDGETFLITPACMYSRNQGDFIVTRGIKGAIDEDVADSKLSPPMPVAQYKQETQNTNVATNANGNWFHAETGKYESVSGVEEECVYIYQYVPGVRFAKYRLVPDNQLPVVYPTLTLATAYNDNNNKTEITHFNGVSTWNRPSGFGDANPENSRVWIESYTYQLLDPNGKKIYETEIPEQYNEDGTPVTSYSISTELMDGKTDSIAFNNYTARVAVNYKFATGSTQQSVFNLAIANNDYPAEPATGLGVWVFKQDNRTVGEWVEKDGEWVVVYKEQDAYRVEIDFDEPDFSNHDSEEPVSNYTVYAIPTINGAVTEDTIPLTGFELHKGSEVVNGVTRAICEITDQIPGTYDFENSKAPYYSTGSWSGGESHQNVVLTWHHVVDNGTYNEETLNTRSVKYDEPHMWKYYVVANYAASNEYIRKPAEAVIETDVDDGLIGTGVEVVGNDGASSLQIYPIPACTSITIKSGETINTIVIYNESGAEVMNIDGNGDTITNVNVENLVAGFYFVKINNQAPVKIIKK